MEVMLLRFMCFTICLGVFLIFRSKILYFVKSFTCMKTEFKISKSHIVKHLRKILQVITNGKHINEKIIIFIFISLALLFTMGMLMFKTFGCKGLIPALVMSSIPYGYIRAKLMLKQVTGSFEGEMLISELINQYKMCEENIYETIDKCILELDDSTLSKKALFQLKLKLNSFTGDEELRETLNDFVINWNTIWARMLADNIYNAIKEDVNILLGLENIMEQGKEITKFIEEDKKDGMETEVMVKILCPLFSIVMLLMARNMVGYTWNMIFTYIFKEPIGLILFSVFVFLIGINIVILPILGKQKYDF